MSTGSPESSSTQPRSRRISRRKLIEIAVLATGIGTTVRAGFDSMTAASAVYVERDRRMPVFITDSTAARLTEGSDRVSAVKTPTTEQKRLSDLASALAAEAPSYGQRRKQLETDLWAKSNNEIVLGNITRDDLRHWAFWGGLGSAALSALSTTKIPDRLARKVLGTLTKSLRRT